MIARQQGTAEKFDYCAGTLRFLLITAMDLPMSRQDIADYLGLTI